MIMKLLTPKGMVLLAAALALLVSLVFWFSGYIAEAIYVGIWVPTILILGIYIETRKSP